MSNAIEFHLKAFLPLKKEIEIGITELGIDEAGRGPVLGPMVLAGVVVPKGMEELLISWGIRDSKSYGSGKSGKNARRELSERIMEQFAHRIISLSSQTVDDYVRESSLNLLEQQTAKTLIQELPAGSVVMDGANLFSPLAGANRVAVNKADSAYLSVAAASILAKTERDKSFAELCKPFLREYGEIEGGGYANKKTLQFVQWHIEERGALPSFYRKSYRWKALDSLNLTEFWLRSPH